MSQDNNKDLPCNYIKYRPKDLYENNKLDDSDYDSDSNRRAIYEEIGKDNKDNQEKLENSAKKLRDLDREFGGMEKAAGEVKGDEENKNMATNKEKIKEIYSNKESSEKKETNLDKEDNQMTSSSESSAHKSFIYKKKIRRSKSGKKIMGKMNLDLDEIADMHKRTESSNKVGKNKISPSQIRKEDSSPNFDLSSNNINNILNHKSKDKDASR